MRARPASVTHLRLMTRDHAAPDVKVSHMYREFFGLRCLPFEDIPDPKFFYPAPDHEEALALLRLAASSRKGPLLLTGGLGTGKTVLCRTLLACPNHEHGPVLNTCTAADPTGLIRRVCKALRMRVGNPAAPIEDAERLKKLILAGKSPGRQVIPIVFDQVENLTLPQLEELHILCNLGDHDHRLVQIILVGRPSVAQTLEDPRFEQLRQRIFAYHRLRPLNAEEVPGYVRHRLRVAGNGDDEPFTADAMTLIHERSSGIPRVINHICDAALLAAYGAECKVVGPDLVAEIDVPAVATSTRPGSPKGPTTPAAHAPSPGPGEAVPNRIEQMLADGEALARRLEQTLERAEHLATQPTADNPLPADQGAQNTEALANRLAGLLLQAPKALQAAEQSLKIVERRIEAACERAERINGHLENTIARSDQLSDATARRLQSIDEACDRATAARDQLAERAENALRKLEQTKVSPMVDQTLARIQERSRQSIAEHNDSLERLSGQCDANAQTLQAGIAAAQENSGKLASLTQAANAATRQATSAIADAHAAADQLAEQIEARNAEADAIESRLQQTLAAGQAAAEAVRQTTAQTTAQATAKAETATRALNIENGAADEKTARLASLVQAAIEAGRQADSRCENVQTVTERLDQKVLEATTTVETIERRLQAATAEAQAPITAVHDALGSLDESVGRARAAEETLRCQTGTAREESENLGSVISAGTEARRRIAAAMDDAHATIEQIGAKIADGQTAADAISHGIRAGIADGQSAVEDLQHHLERSVANGQDGLERIERRLAAGLDDAHKSTAAIREQLQGGIADAEAGCRDLEQRIQTAATQCDATAQDIEDGIQASLAAGQGETEALQHRIQIGIADARTQTEQIEQSLRHGILKAQSMGDGLDRTLARADTSIDAIRAQTDAAQKTCDRTASLIDSAGRTTADLERQLDSTKGAEERVRQLTDSMSALGIEAEERVARLAAGTDRSAKVLDALQQNVSSAQNLTDRLDADAPRIESTQAEMARQIQQALAIAQQLAENDRTAQQTLDRIAQQNAAAQDTATQLSQQTVEATDALDRHAAEATNVLPRLLKAIRAAATTVKQLNGQREASLATLQHHQTLHDHDRELILQLQEQTGDAKELLAQLSDRSAEGTRIGQLIATECRSASDVLTQTGRQIEAIDQRKEAIEASDRTLAEFIEQAETISRQVTRLQAQADSLDVRIRQVLGQPERVVAEAKDQSIQLQNVCRAVRKVFAGLSQAALQANQRIEQFSHISRTSEDRVRRLSAETTRTAETLQSWVAEAAQAQTRLAEVIEQCPTVSRTRPTESLSRLTMLADRLGGPPRSSAPTRQTSPADLLPVESLRRERAACNVARQPIADDRPVGAPPSSHRTRAEEVARLIADAERLADRTR